MVSIPKIDKPEVTTVPIGDLSGDDTFMNRVNLENIEELAESIKRDGQHVPVILRGGSPPYQIVSGFRRVEATKRAGLPTVHAIIHSDITEQKAHRISLLENLERETLSGYEQVLAAGRMRNGGLNVKEIADAFRLETRTIQRYLKLRNCSPEVREALHRGQISISVAYEVEANGVPLHRVLSRGLSVRQIKALARAKKVEKRPEQYVRFRKFRKGNFNLTLKYKAGLTDIDGAIGSLEEALGFLREEKARGR